MAVSLPTSHIFCREFSNKAPQQHHQQQWGSYSAGSNRVPLSRGALSRRGVVAEAFWQGTAKATSVEMEAVTSSEHLDQILLEAQEESPPKPVIIDWMANWCRKCIYLKPKLEKLAAEYDTRLKFYYVDVNSVSQALVKRGNVLKMPTIQLWKDGEMKEEVIGGHKAWLVIDEVRQMIEKYI